MIVVPQESSSSSKTTSSSLSSSIAFPTNSSSTTSVRQQGKQPSPLRLKKGSKMITTNTTSPNPKSSPASSPTDHRSIPPSYTLIDSSFQMAEYLALLIQKDPKDVDRIVKMPASTIPGGGVGEEVEEDREGTGSPKGEGAGKKEVDLWVYEHLRRLPQDLTPLLTSLLPICSRQTCPEMKAAEWVYLCVAHPAGSVAGIQGQGQGQGGMSSEGCSAIDYILHTVDQHTALWNSAQAFPSRLSIKAGSERYFGQQARRISRVFGHAWFHHREVFEICEAENALYARFLALIRRYGLMAESLLVIPWDEPEPKSEPPRPTAEKQDHIPNATVGLKRSGSVKVASKREDDEQDADVEDQEDDDDDEDGDFRRDRLVAASGSGGPSTAVKRGTSSGSMRGMIGAGRNGRGKSVRGRRKLFHVDIPNEEDEDGDADDLLGKRLAGQSDDSAAAVDTENNAGVAKFATPTLNNPLAGDPSQGVPIPPSSGPSSESDEESDDGSEGASDPEDAVNPDGGSVDSDDEDEKMVEDVGSGR